MFWSYMACMDWQYLFLYMRTWKFLLKNAKEVIQLFSRLKYISNSSKH